MKNHKNNSAHNQAGSDSKFVHVDGNRSRIITNKNHYHAEGYSEAIKLAREQINLYKKLYEELKRRGK